MTRKTSFRNSRQTKLIVSDNDGTILSLQFLFAPAMLAAIPIVAAAMNEPAEIVGGEIGRNMINHTALETAFPFVGPYFAEKWKGTDEEFVEQVTKPFFSIVDTIYGKYATAFPGVRETFDVAELLGVKIVILSDGPMQGTLSKLTALGLNKRVAGVYSLEPAIPQGADVWNQADFDFCSKRLQRLLALASGFDTAKIVQLPRSFEKPNTQGLQRILSDFNVAVGQAIMLGDNCQKDGGVADALGMRFGFARYGVNDFTPPQYTELLSSIVTPSHDTTIFWQHTAMPADLPPIHKVLTTYADVIPILRANRRGSTRAKAA
jgi:FMN phosphatase YigB (HAD superfamily)